MPHLLAWQARIGRFHNIYGPCGTWKGGREKAPAAFCRKGITSEKEFEMWGNGKQTRSFCYIDDAIEGILRLMVSDYKKPLNIGSDEMVSMNQMAELVFKIGKKTLPIKCDPSPGPWALGPAPWPPPRPRMLAAPRRRDAMLARSLAAPPQSLHGPMHAALALLG